MWVTAVPPRPHLRGEWELARLVQRSHRHLPTLCLEQRRITLAPEEFAGRLGGRVETDSHGFQSPPLTLCLEPDCRHRRESGAAPALERHGQVGAAHLEELPETRGERA